MESAIDPDLVVGQTALRTGENLHGISDDGILQNAVARGDRLPLAGSPGARASPAGHRPGDQNGLADHETWRWTIGDVDHARVDQSHKSSSPIKDSVVLKA